MKLHVNISSGRLAALCRDAALYWRATGLDAPLVERPAAAERFGITVLEAVSAGCMPLAFNAGGPREVVSHGVDGMLCSTLDELADSSARLLAPGADRVREAMGHAAARRAAAFAPEVFRDRVRTVLLG